MGTTANRGYVYPDSTSDTHIWTHLQTLADDVDADVETVENAQATCVGGPGNITADSATWGVTESGALLSVTAAFVTGKIYWITVTCNVSADVAGDSPLLRIREDTATGTQLVGRQGYCPTTSVVGYLMTFSTKVTALATGSKTYVVTGVRNGGTGTAHRIRASGSNPAWIRVDRIPT